MTNQEVFKAYIDRCFSGIEKRNNNSPKTNYVMSEINDKAKLIAIKMLRDAVEYGKYKQWNSDVGDKKAQEIVDEFHSGKYGRRDGFWVQVNWAIELLEKESKK